jgi:hypothetical protein
MWLVSAFSPRRPGLDSKSGAMGFMVDEVALGQVLPRVLYLPLPILSPLTALH